MFEERFLEQALNEMEQLMKERDYWKQKYLNLEQTCRELICWIKETYKWDNERCEKTNTKNT